MSTVDTRQVTFRVSLCRYRHRRSVAATRSFLVVANHIIFRLLLLCALPKNGIPCLRLFPSTLNPNILEVRLNRLISARMLRSSQEQVSSACKLNYVVTCKTSTLLIVLSVSYNKKLQINFFIFTFYFSSSHFLITGMDLFSKLKEIVNLRLLILEIVFGFLSTTSTLNSITNAVNATSV